MEIHAANYLGSFPSVDKCPDSDLPEYAFIGRSNVGKSSLINMLCNRKALARVSNQPGKTRAINLFAIEEEWILSDLPGYGYAKVSKTMRKAWSGMIEHYLLERPNLMCVFVLLDFRLPLQEIDRELIAKLGENAVPFVLIYTKTDKVHHREHAKHQAQIEDALLEDWNTLPPRFLVSAVSGEGRDALLQYIAGLNDRARGI